MKLEFYVGDCSIMDVCCDWDDFSDGLMPKDLVEQFEQILTWDESPVMTIRVVRPILLNYVGERIERGNLSEKDVTVFTNSGTHRYNRQGVLSEGDPWPHGIFSY